ncbi:MAG: hypothetical protein ACM31L_02070 [Actinomycetota bacterium]
MRRMIMGLALAAVVAGGAVAAEVVDRPKWMGADKIATFDKEAARQSGPVAQLLDPKVAADDDIVPGVLWLGPALGNVLVVRFSAESSCGRFAYTFFGPVVGDKRTAQLSACADDLFLAHAPGRKIPEVLLRGAQPERRFAYENGSWQPK